MMRRRTGYMLAAIAALMLGSAATGLYSIATGRDETMERLCSIPPILDEDAFFADRVAFNWLATSGTPIGDLDFAIPGYAPAQGARFEEMRVERVSEGALANVVTGLGRAWAGPPLLPYGSVVDAPDHTPVELRPPLAGGGNLLLLFELDQDAQSCALQEWFIGEIARSGGDLDSARDDDWVASRIREQLELSVPVALSSARERMRSGRCLSASWVPRDRLPLHAYRAYETRHAGLVNYWLSPHIVSRDGRVVFFSMAVVRRSALYDVLNIEAPDPLERTCCVSPLRTPHCSRFGGPDPYRFDISERRAVRKR
ncbi:MAG: hypothetical protein R3C31_00140 [Hyphomonadaceae bacterium]